MEIAGVDQDIEYPVVRNSPEETTKTISWKPTRTNTYRYQQYTKIGDPRASSNHKKQRCNY